VDCLKSNMGFWKEEFLTLNTTLFYHSFITNSFLYSLLNKNQKNEGKTKKKIPAFCAQIKTQKLHNEENSVWIFCFFFSLSKLCFHCSFFIVYCPVEPDVKYWQKYEVKLHLLIFFLSCSEGVVFHVRPRRAVGGKKGHDFLCVFFFILWLCSII
jgi:hypothetical protein